MPIANIPFPLPGSIARVEGLIWRIHQLNADGTALLIRERDEGAASGASFSRRHPVADLVDPTLDDLPIEGLDRIGIEQIKWLRETLRHANAVVFTSLHSDMIAAARRNEVPTIRSEALVGLLRRLGWSCTRNTAMPRALTIWERHRAQAVAA